MFAKDLISDNIMPLKSKDNGITALNWMDEYRVSQLPIVENAEFLGMVTDIDVYNFNNPQEQLGKQQITPKKTYAPGNMHIFDVIKTFSVQNLSLLPVLDEKEYYIGSITLFNLVKNFAEISAIKNPGGIIILELNTNDYNLSEISQIIESNDTKVLGLYIRSHTHSTKLDVSIKVNKIDIKPILQTFNRYDYIIKASFSEDEKYYDDLQKRFDSLMNYLNI